METSQWALLSVYCLNLDGGGGSFGTLNGNALYANQKPVSVDV